MDYRTLGSSGCAVSTLALGTMTFGAEADEAASHASSTRSSRPAATLVDTADVYSAGGSEEIIGRWLAERPADVTGPGGAGHQGPLPDGRRSRTASGCRARHLTRALDASLRRLGVDAVDLYQAHAWDPLTPLEETLRTSTASSGPARSATTACRTSPAGSCTKAVAAGRAALDLARPVTLQPQYNLLVREIEWEIVPAAWTRASGCCRGRRWAAAG